MTSWRRLLAGMFLLQAGCARVPPPEPVVGRQLWQEEKCFAHELPEWKHLELRELRGTVVAGGTAQPDPLPESRVFARSWPSGPHLQTATDANGVFEFPDVGEGTYELAICRDGWNPWRGTVRVSRSAQPKRGMFTLLLGW